MSYYCQKGHLMSWATDHHGYMGGHLIKEILFVIDVIQLIPVKREDTVAINASTIYAKIAIIK